MTQYTPSPMLEWLSCVIDCIAEGYPNVSILRRQRSGQSYLAILLATSRIDDSRVGLRKFVIAALDTGGDALQASEIPEELEILKAELGVVHQCFLANNSPSDDARLHLERLGVSFVMVQGNEFPSPPDAEYCARLARVLLGGIPIIDTDQDSAGLEPEKHEEISEDQTSATIDQVLIATLLLYLAEEIVLSPSDASWQTVSTSSSGGRNFLSSHYAIQEVSQKERSPRYYMPDGQELLHKFHMAVKLRQLLSRIHPSPTPPPTLSALRNLLLDFAKYYYSWLLGISGALEKGSIAVMIEEFREAPYAQFLSSRLSDSPNIGQIQFLTVIGALQLRGATDDVLALLPDANPTVQEACLRCLIQLGTVKDVALISRYARSPRHAVAESAAELLSRIRTDEAAGSIVELLESGDLPLSEKTVLAVARTYTPTAIQFLLNLCSSTEGNVPPIALEEAIDHILPKVESGEVSYRIDNEWLLRICEKLYATEPNRVLCRRVALKLIRFFRPANGQKMLLEALEDESVRTRVAAMTCAGAFPDENIARAIVLSANNPPTGYDTQQLTEWLIASMEVRNRQDGPGGIFHSTSDLDLVEAARKSLQQMGPLYMERYGNRIIDKQSRSDNEELNIESTGDGLQREVTSPQTVAEAEHVYKTPDGTHIWVSYQKSALSDESDEDMPAFASIVHDNNIPQTPTVPTASAMLGGGIIMTTGKKGEILRDVVWPCLRGKEPNLPVSVGMGETVLTDFKTGKQERKTFAFEESGDENGEK